MPYEAVFFTTLPEGTSIHDRFDSGEFRATAVLRTGPYAAIAFTPMDASRPRLMSTCMPGDPNCDPGVLGQVLSYVSAYRPQDVIVFALAHIRPGSLRTWASKVRETGDRAGVSVAAAYLYGIRDANILLELVGADLDALQELLLDLVDREEVRDFQVMHTTPDDVRGFGSDEAASLS